MFRFALASSVIVMTAPAFSQVAYVVAPEQSSGLSFALSVSEAIEFATEECIYGGVEQGYSEAEMHETCQLVTACAYGDWAVMISLFGEIHWSEFYCGLPNEAAARAVAQTICAADRPGVGDCAVTQIYDGGRWVLE